MIHRFRVQNFKSIVDVDVDLSPVTVLVGKSGTGKSNFVQALRFLRDVLISKSDPTTIVASVATGDGVGRTHDLLCRILRSRHRREVSVRIVDQ